MGIKNIASIVLAAGAGTRMKSDKAKVIHKIHNVPMILYVIKTAYKAVGENIIAVIGHQAEQVKAIIEKKYDIQYAYQKEQLGTGHAVKCALPYLFKNIKNILVLYGDVPLIQHETLIDFINYHYTNNYELTVLGVRMKDPYGYGRLIINKYNMVSAIVEEADTDDYQKSINIVNSGIYCVDKNLLTVYLDKIQPKNAQKELYLTDIIALAYNDHKKIGLFIKDDSFEFFGINSCEDLERINSKVKTDKLEEKHCKGYEKYPVNADEFSVWETEQVWSDL
jgi:UDP-N-acetylglucosamine pyrophosphorylase